MILSYIGQLTHRMEDSVMPATQLNIARFLERHGHARKTANKIGQVIDVLRDEGIGELDKIAHIIYSEG